MFEMQFAFRSFKTVLHVCLYCICLNEIQGSHGSETCYKIHTQKNLLGCNFKAVLNTGNHPESKLPWFVCVSLFPSSQRSFKSLLGSRLSQTVYRGCCQTLLIADILQGRQSKTSVFTGNLCAEWLLNTLPTFLFNLIFFQVSKMFLLQLLEQVMTYCVLHKNSSIDQLWDVGNRIS